MLFRSVNENGTTSLHIKNVKNLPSPFLFPSESTKENFSTQKLAPYWLCMRNADLASYSLSDRKGYMRLYGNHFAIDDIASPTFLGRRQQHFYFIAETCVEFTPKNNNEEAGLLIEMKNDAYYKFTLTKKDGKRIIQLGYRLKSLRQTIAEYSIPEGLVYLRITGDKEMYSFSWSVDGKKYTDLGKLEVNFLSAEVTGGYNGVLLGMYASGNGVKSSSHADFDYFIYKKNKYIRHL